MKNHPDVGIVKTLIEEEHRETDLVDLYSALLSLNAAENLSPEFQEEFKNTITNLRNDSKRHFLALTEILKNYEH
ncbi:MAG: hypothetical protein WC757_00480 [Candidatus Paceibacterota bacterium]|jgi:hypothetical protein